MHSLLPPSQELHDTLCALQVIAQCLSRASRYQLLTYLDGSFAQLTFLSALVQLHSLIHSGVCRATRVLEDSEVPNLTPLLAQLPDDMRVALEQAVEAERAGHCAHGLVSDHAESDAVTGATAEPELSVESVASVALSVTASLSELAELLGAGPVVLTGSRSRMQRLLQSAYPVSPEQLGRPVFEPAG